MWCENPPTMIARCTCTIWSVGMCNKSDHADISQYTAHVCLLSLMHGLHLCNTGQIFTAIKRKVAANTQMHFESLSNY